jgi:hypothetical protein
VAALWLAHHGRQTLLRRYRPPIRLQHVFRHLLRKTARRWNQANIGPGILDAKALLEAELPDADDIANELPADPLRMLPVEEVAARLIGEPDPAPVRDRLAAAFGAPAAVTAPSPRTEMAAGDVDEALAKFGLELFHVLAEDRAAAAELRASLRPAGTEAIFPVVPEGVVSAEGMSEIARVASPTLRARLRR